MEYNILEARIEYKEGYVNRVTVLVEMSKGDIRAIFATTKSSCNGYHYMAKGEKISEQLLQQVAGFGMETIDRDDIFPNWRQKYWFK